MQKRGNGKTKEFLHLAPPVLRRHAFDSGKGRSSDSLPTRRLPNPEGQWQKIVATTARHPPGRSSQQRELLPNCTAFPFNPSRRRGLSGTVCRANVAISGIFPNASGKNRPAAAPSGRRLKALTEQKSGALPPLGENAPQRSVSARAKGYSAFSASGSGSAFTLSEASPLTIVCTSFFEAS